MTVGGTVLEKAASRPYAFINALANHPSMRPTIGGDGKSKLDLTNFLDNPRNRSFAWDCGCFLFEWSAPQTFEVHALILPEGRGPEAYRKAAEGIEYIVSEGCERLWARVPKGDDALKHYTVAAGFAHCGEGSFEIVGVGPREYDLYQWTKPCR